MIFPNFTLNHAITSINCTGVPFVKLTRKKKSKMAVYYARTLFAQFSNITCSVNTYKSFRIDSFRKKY